MGAWPVAGGGAWHVARGGELHLAEDCPWLWPVAESGAWPAGVKAEPVAEGGVWPIAEGGLETMADARKEAPGNTSYSTICCL